MKSANDSESVQFRFHESVFRAVNQTTTNTLAAMNIYSISKCIFIGHISLSTSRKSLWTQKATYNVLVTGTITGKQFVVSLYSDDPT